MASYLDIIRGLNKIPGVGKKSAERITFYLLESNHKETHQLLENIKEFIDHTQKCKICGLISKKNPCNVCSSNKRDSSVICIVKNIQDALTIERSKIFNGLYHVLGKNLSDNIHGKDINFQSILKRINLETKEVIFALENNQAGNVTIKYLIKIFHKKNSKINFTQMATGIPIGTSLEYIDKETLKSSLTHRYAINS